jgi:hypothetical protein
MEEELGLVPCKVCGFLPYIVEEPIRGYEPEVNLVLKHNPHCWITPRIPKTDTIYRSKGEALYNLITAWNDYMNNVKIKEKE